MSTLVQQLRRSFREGDAIRDAGLTTPEDVVRYDSIAYGPSPAEQSLDVYRPAAAAGTVLPVLVSVHGGGWVYGDKELYQYYCMSLAQRGFAVVNFTYRLAPENRFPACLEDTCTVFRWVLDHGEQYGMDLNRIFAAGDSAGAHILGLFVNLCTNPSYAARFPFQAPPGFVPRALALNCGAFQLDAPGFEDTLQAILPDLLGRNPTPEDLDTLSVPAHITEDFPPTFLMTSTDDFLRGQVLALAGTLSERGIPFVLRQYGSTRHRLFHVFHCDLRTGDAAVCNDEECAFFRRISQQPLP